MMDFITECNLPFSIIKKPSFSTMISTVSGRDVSIPSVSVFMKYIAERYDEMQNKLSILLNRNNYLCITCDVWSSRAQSYLGMTVHYIDEFFVRQSYTLAFRSLTGKQTHDVLAKEILKVLDEYKIPLEKITNIVTDGGSAFCKAFKVFGHGSDPLMEGTNETNSVDEDPEQSEESILPFMHYDDGEYFYSNILNFAQEKDDGAYPFQDEVDEEHTSTSTENVSFTDYLNNEYDDENGEEQIVSKKLPSHRRCLAHLLNLIAAHFENELSGHASTALVATLNKLQALWVLPRRSSLANSICKEVLDKKLRIPCQTRWNSKYDALLQVYQLRSKMNEYVQKLQTSLKDSTSLLRQFDQNDWTVISNYLKVMEPIAVSLDKLQGEKDCGQGFVLPTLISMKHRILSLQGGQVLKDFQEVMMRVVNRRFENFFRMNEANRELVVGALSTPRFKSSFIADEDDLIQTRRMLAEECIKISTIEIETTETDVHGQNQDDDFFVSFLTRPILSRRYSIEQTIDSEINRFFDDKRKDYTMLHEYPHIKEVFFKFNTTLASSAAVERLFSQCSQIFTPRRNRILAINFERQLLLKQNKKIFTLI